MKKVRYLMGAAGVAPAALGLLAQGPPATAAAHTTQLASTAGHRAHLGKAVRVHPGQTVYVHPDGSCIASHHRQQTEHYSTNTSMTLYFWSAHHGSKTCIGTIGINAHGFIKSVEGQVFGKDLQAYCQRAGFPPIQWGCHGSFYNPFTVSAYAFVSGHSISPKIVSHVG